MSTVFLLALDILVAAFLVLYVLPELYARLWLRRPAKAVVPGFDPDTPFIALTFDDGPDPVTTPLVLQALDDLDIKATFFMLGDRVAPYPEVARQVRDKGHLVASHGHRHGHHWLMSPLAVQRDLRRGRQALETLGLVPYAGLGYRPPWGMVTLATLRAVRHAGMRLCLYDVESGDWLRGGPDDIAKRVVRNARPGSVVLLHDAAEDPVQVETMLRALRKIAPLLREQGYRFTTVSAPPPGRGRLLAGPPLLLRAWMAWERLFGRMVKAIPLTETVHLAPYTYHGPDRLLNGQVALKSGDRCLDVHFQSEVLTGFAGDSRSRLAEAWRRVQQDMGRIAVMLAQDPQFADVKALTAITLFHRFTARVGFRAETLEPPLKRRFFSWYMRLIMRIYGGSAADSGREAMFVWTTRDEAIARMRGSG